MDDPAATAAVRIDVHTRRVADRARGFLPADEAEALWDAAWAMAPEGVIVEIGSYCGKSATWLGAAARLRGGTVVTVDHHRGSEENQAGWEHHDASLVDPATGLMDTLPHLRTTLHDAGLEHVVIAIVGRSTAVAALWSTPIAMLFIDGGHAEEHARNDYRGWAGFVAPQGVLAIHDVFEAPADGGQAPYEQIYRPAIEDGFTEVRKVGSLRVLRRA
ncbi:MAG TPA: class I SAM-dependent methyltransferase [Mycobacteriales bacterium]|nr:class I SAM-dependent methyltransferase [Mycobacteriales bacterium]